MSSVTKSEIRNPKSETSTNFQNSKHYDLEDRTFIFARDVRVLIKKLPRSLEILEDAKQLVRSSGSVGANYREANESTSKKDFLFRMKICRKEAKESQYWLGLIGTNEMGYLGSDCSRLEQEAKELMMIFGAILNKSI